jgi:hypothetical protein
MRALFFSLPLVFALSVMAHAEDYRARADKGGNIELQATNGDWYPLDIRTRHKGGVVHVPPGVDSLTTDGFEFRQIGLSTDGYRYFVLRVQ